MLDYIFFNKKTCDLFAESATSAGITAIVDCADDCFTVRLPEDSNDKLLEELEAYYDELLDMDRDLADAQEQETSAEMHTAGISVALNDGRHVYAQVAPELLSRVLQCISPDELNTIVCAITEAVENPDTSSLCQR
ncbi:MAG TPA: hypothetical protein ENJ11_10040 [Gammaproteobacteria bacterium]|nr:hypothetical protein [Gammaproteobacteria bacterium]